MGKLNLYERPYHLNEDDVRWVQETLAGMTLEEKIGQVEPTLVVTASILIGLILLSVMLPLMHIMTAIG